MNAPLKIGLLAAAVAAFVTFASLPWGMSASPAVVDAVDRLDGEWVGRDAPGFELPDLQGQPRQLADFRGQVIFLNFWASFCEPCKREMPSMERLVRDYDDRGLTMLAISLDPERDDMEGFMNQFLGDQASRMTVLWDPTGQTSQAYGTELLPETYLIDREGRVVARFVGEYDWNRPEARQLVEALLSG